MTEEELRENGPKIGIISPSYNQAEFVGEMLESVVAQEYQNFEHVIVDGGINDGSLDIIRKYERNIHFLYTGPDQGQSDAINFGVKRTTADLISWLNTDDRFLPNCLSEIARAYVENDQPDIITANIYWIDSVGSRVRASRVPRQTQFWFKKGVWYATAPCIFFRKSLFENIGGLDISLRLSMDIDMWIKMMRLEPKIVHINRYLGEFRLHPGSKSLVSQTSKREISLENSETSALYSSEFIETSERSRRLWRTVFRLRQALFLNYLRAWLDVRFKT